MPLNFFSAINEYAAAPQPEDITHEFRALVNGLHAAGIEVVLDAGERADVQLPGNWRRFLHATRMDPSTLMIHL